MKKSEIRKAAKGAATTPIDLGKFVKDGEVGKLLQEMNVMHVGLSMYVFSKSRLEKAIDRVEEKLAEPGLEDETYATLVDLQRKLIAEYNVTTKGMIETVNSPESKQDSGTRVILPPNTVFTAVSPEKLNES